MKFQKSVHENVASEFDSKLAKTLAEGYRIVPGTYCYTSMVRHYPATKYDNPRNETANDYFVVVERDSDTIG